MLRKWVDRVAPESMRKFAKRNQVAAINMVLLIYYRIFRGSREVVDPALLESLRAEFGEAFGGYIDWRDEMYQIVYDTMSPQGTRKPCNTYGTDRAQAQTSYFSQGRQCRDDLARILARHHKTMEDLSGLLEFASGYGRVTRFLVDRLDARRIWVADVSADALEINSTCFGTTTRLSSSGPEGFECEQNFEVVFAGMIFSHFSIDVWNLWLSRLYDLVEPSGLLIFSTMGPELLPREGADRYLLDENGFWFMPENETAGRLEASKYGTTFVSATWVSEQIKLHGVGELIGCYPKGLANWQDIYVVRNSA